MMGGLLLVMILMSVFTSRKDRKRRAELIASLEKGAKVQTAGGIIGVVSELGDDEVVLRVEEGRLRFAKSAIAAVLKPARDKPAPADVEVKGDRARSPASL
jgi:preprotein translocase subunit YajC